MADIAKIRLNKVLKEFNISLDRAVDFLASKGHEIDSRPTTKISDEVYQVLQDEFQTDKSKKVASKEVGEEKRKEKEALRLQLEQEQEDRRLARERRSEASTESRMVGRVELAGPRTVGKIDLDADIKKKTEPVKEHKTAEPEPETQPKTVVKEEAPKVKEEEKTAEKVAEKPAEEKPTEEKTEEKKPGTEAETEPENQEDAVLKTNYKKLSGPTITAKIDLSQFKKAKKKKEETPSSDSSSRKKRRKRIVSKAGNTSTTAGIGRNFKKGGRRSTAAKVEPTEEDVQKQIRETLEKLQGKSKKGKGAKYRRDKRDQHRQQTEKDFEQQEIEDKTLKVTEFVTANEIATMMDVST